MDLGSTPNILSRSPLTRSPADFRRGTPKFLGLLPVGTDRFPANRFFRRPPLAENRAFSACFNRICFKMPTRSSSTLWFKAPDVSVYLQSKELATVLASAIKKYLYEYNDRPGKFSSFHLKILEMICKEFSCLAIKRGLYQFS